ncbi:hypothetical protein UFOVP1279_37 [uncultured Caudovirales phage]|uniref:Tape measure protein n=1 Tax=uncultured Caudovirales phage TaxID=2100421 RepID=A0A6J5RT74_9CAUD|nr:hypothetical protein UFOVP1279_37 [uncultured Caudovirales phage]
MAQEVERLVAEVEVKTTKALAAIKKWKKQVRKELKELVKESVELALDGNTKQIDAKIKKLRKELEEKEIVVKSKVKVDTKDAKKTVKEFKETSGGETETTLGVDKTKASIDVKEFSAKLKELSTVSADPELDVNPARGLAHIRELREKLRELTANSLSIDIDVDDTVAKIKLADTLSEAEKLDGKLIKSEIKLEGAVESSAEAQILARELDNVGDQSNQTSKQVSGLDRDVSKLGRTMSVGAIAAAAFKKALGRDKTNDIGKSAKESNKSVLTASVGMAVFRKSIDRVGNTAVVTGVKLLGMAMAAGAATLILSGMSTVATVVSGAVAALGAVVAALAVEMIGLAAVAVSGMSVALMGLGGMFSAVALGAGSLMLAFQGIAEGGDEAAAQLRFVMETFGQDMKFAAQDMRKILIGPLLDAAKSIKDKLFPVLLGGMEQFAGAMGGVITKLVDTLTSGDVINNLRTIFAGLVPVLVQVGDIISNMASGFMSLFAASLPAVKEFSFFMVQLSDGFTGWVEKIKNNGDLDRFLRDGINSFKLILNATLEWGGAIMQILKWALPMGLGLAQGFFMAANAFNAWTNSMEGAAKIRSVIESFEPLIHSVGHLLVTLVKNLGSVIAEVLPLVEPVIAGITEIIPDIAAAFKLLAPIGLGIISALIPIVPMLMPIVEAVAKIAAGFTTTLLPVVFTLVGALGRIAPVVANVAGSFSNFIKIFGELIKPIEMVVLAVGPMLVNLFDALFPAVQRAAAVIGPLAAAFAISLADGIHDVGIALIPLIPAFQDFASRVMPILTKQMDILKPIIMELVWKFVDIARAAMDMAASFIEWTDKAGILTPILKGLIALFVVSKVVSFTTAILKMMYAMTVGPIVGMTTALAKFILQLGSAAGVDSMTVALNALTTAETANAKAPKKSPLFAAWKAWRTATTTQTVATEANTVATGELAVAETAAVGPTGVLTGAIASLNAMLIANPIGIIVAAIVALVAGIVLLYFHWKPFRDLVDSTWQALQLAWDQFLVGAKVVGGALVDAFKAAWPAIKKVWDIFSAFYIQPLVEAFKFLARILTGDVSGAFKGLGEYLGSVWDSIKGFAGSIIDLAAGAGNAMLDFSKKLFSAGIDLLAGMLRGAISGSAKIIQFFLDLPMNILKAIPDIISWLWYKGLELLSGFVNGMYNGMVLLVKFWLGVGKAIVGALTGSAKWLWNTGKDLVMGLWHGINSAWHTVLDFFVKLPRRIIDAMTDAASWLYETGKSVLNGMWEGIKSAWHSVEDFFKALPARIMESLRAARTWLHDTGVQILEGLRDGWNRGWENTKSFFTNLPKNIAKFLSDARRWLTKTGLSILKGLEDGIRSGWRSLQSFFTELPGRIANWFTNARRWLNDRGREIISGLSEGLRTRAAAVWDWFKELPSRITKFFKNSGKWLFESGKNIIKGLWEGVKSVGGWFGKRFNEVLKAIIPDAMEKQFGIASPSKVMATYGVYLMQGLGVGIVQGSPEVSRSMDSLFGQMTAKTVAYTPPPVAAPTLPTAQLSAGIDAMRATAVAKAAELTTQFGNALGTGVTAAGVSAKVNANIAGQNVVIGMQNGLVSNGQIIAQAAFDRGQNAVANINAGAGTAAGASTVSSATGQNVIAGLINGMVEQGVPLSEAAAKLGLSIPEAMNNALIIKSPSKVMFDVGQNAGVGLADGLNATLPLLDSFFNSALNKVIKFSTDLVDWLPDWIPGVPDKPKSPGSKGQGRGGQGGGGGGGSWGDEGPSSTLSPHSARRTPAEQAAMDAYGRGEQVDPALQNGGWNTLVTTGVINSETGAVVGLDSQGRTPAQQLEDFYAEINRQNAEKWYAWQAAHAFDNADATGMTPMAEIGTPIADIETDKKKKADDALAALMLAIAESLKIIASIDWTAANSVRRPIFGQANVVTTMLGGDKVPGAGLASSAGLGVAPKPMTAYSGNYVGSPNANFAGMSYIPKNIRGVDTGFRGPSLGAMAKPTIASADNGLRSSTNVSAAVVDTGTKQVSQLSKVINELQTINQTIGNVKTAPLIGKIEQNDVGTRSAPEDIIQAALKASALIGR